MGIYFPGAGTLGCAVWPGAGIAHSQDIPPNLYPPHRYVGPPVPPSPICTTPCFCIPPPMPVTTPPPPVWMNVASLNPCLSDFYTALFSDGSGHYLFWGLVVILSVVLWGGEGGLPMPPLVFPLMDMSNSSIILLIFCQLDLSVTDRGVFKSPVIIVGLFIPP